MIDFILCGLGLCFGSFVNALVWRLHSQPKAKSLKLQAKEFSIMHGRSMCVHCHHTLAWYDLIPVLSWLSLKGKCRYCHKPISWQYPLVELTTALLFVLSYIAWPYQLSTINHQLVFTLWLGILTISIALIVYDIRWMLLPDKLTKVVGAFAALYVSLKIISNPLQAANLALGAALGVLCIAGLFYVLFQVSKGKWIGGGDVKLGVALGLLAGGALQAALLIFLASLLGSIFGIPLLIKSKQKSKTRVPFGPFLISSCVIVVLWGQKILDWYIQTLFPL